MENSTLRFAAHCCKLNPFKTKGCRKIFRFATASICLYGCYVDVLVFGSFYKQILIAVIRSKVYICRIRQTACLTPHHNIHDDIQEFSYLVTEDALDTLSGFTSIINVHCQLTDGGRRLAFVNNDTASVISVTDGKQLFYVDKESLRWFGTLTMLFLLYRV